MKSWCWTIESVVLSNGLHLQDTFSFERVMILNAKCVIESSTFSLYDLIVIWLLIHDCRTSIASRCSHDYSSQLLYQKKLHLQDACTRHDTRLFSSRLYHQKDCTAVLLTFRYVFAVRLVRDLITRHDLITTFSWLSSCQCRCLISWYVSSSEAFFLLLAWTSSWSKGSRYNLWWTHFSSTLMLLSLHSCLVHHFWTLSYTYLAVWRVFSRICL